MDTFACVFVAPHEPSRSTWPVLLDLTRATGILVSHFQSKIKHKRIGGLTRRPSNWLMAADSFKVHSACTTGLISFM